MVCSHGGQRTNAETATDGVALAAIQGLLETLDDKDDRIEDLEAENDELRDRLSDLEDRVDRLEDGTVSPAEDD